MLQMRGLFRKVWIKGHPGGTGPASAFELGTRAAYVHHLVVFHLVFNFQIAHRHTLMSLQSITCDTVT